jgi:hypothetical protein
VKPVKYALLIYENAEGFDNRDQPDDSAYYGAWRSYYRSLVEAGVYVGGDPLHAPETGTTVRNREGKRDIQDGPYANTKEQLAGFIVIDVASLDTALEWAARCPASLYAAVEVRPLAPEQKRRITCDVN